MHSYNKCKDLNHLFIICGAVHASCISRNPFKALSIHVNHKTFEKRIENIIFLNLKKKTVAFRCLLYLVVPQTGNQSCVHIHPIGKSRVSPLLSLNTSAVIRYLICIYASHFFAGRPYHFNQTLRTANKF